MMHLLKHFRGYIALASLALVMTACGMVTGEIPKDYPLPIYPSASAPADGYHEAMGARSLILNTHDSIDAVHQFYIEKLKADGWDITNDKKAEQAYSIDAKKGDESANVTVQENTIILTYIKL